mmetsp:Transcript_51451/g.137995  ORF Transcript_51451/g.137995 Transcript_51451/m.137995 type:complete len:218 (+) Transcript_51451:229-882(+)
MPVAAIRRSRRVLLPLGVHLPALIFHGRPKTPSSASARHEHIKAEFVRLLEEDVEAAVVWCSECTRGQLVDADRVDVRAQGLDARQHVDPILNNVASVGHADADAEEFVSGHRVVEPGALDLDGVQPEYTLLAREQSLAPRHSRGALVLQQLGNIRLLQASTSLAAGALCHATGGSVDGGAGEADVGEGRDVGEQCETACEGHSASHPSTWATAKCS